MLKLREIERQDMVKINKWHNDVKLSQNLGGSTRFVNSEVDEAWFDHYLASRASNVRCAILDDNEVVGVVYLLSIDPINLSGELHIMIGEESSRGKGIGTFAVHAMVEYAFYNLNLRRIQLDVLETNEAARSLYRKIGFKDEGMKRKAVYKNGEYINVIIMALLREEYRQ